jgi:hypothetical protein
MWTASPTATTRPAALDTFDTTSNHSQPGAASVVRPRNGIGRWLMVAWVTESHRMWLYAPSAADPAVTHQGCRTPASAP